MKTEPKPQITVSFAVDLELEYDPFNGKTPQEIANSLDDDMGSLLLELNPNVVGVYTSVTSVQTNG